MKRIFIGGLITLVVLITIPFIHPPTLRSIPPASIKDTLSTSQLSYFARLGAGASINDTIIKIALSGNPSNDTYNLFVGDTIGIGMTATTTSPLSLYTIRDIGNTAIIEINSGLGSSNVATGVAIVATRSAIHTVTFTPKSAVTGNGWQFLIKATSRSGEAINDGIPDQQGFDLGATTPSSGASGLGTRLKAADVICPFGLGTTATGIGTTAVVNGNSYHVITCQLGAGQTNTLDVGASFVVGSDLATGSQLINPSAALSHTIGQADTSADTYLFFIRHLDAAGNVIDADTASGRIAVTEAVRVTATVDPTITFIIDNTNVGVGASRCGLAGLSGNAANTTASSVAFGPLTLAVANNLAQRLSCITNAVDGYVVTVYEATQMSAIGVTSAAGVAVTIPDTNCGGNNCTTSTPQAWTDFTASGWGYTMENINIGTSIFSYANYKPFPVGAANSVQIMKNTSTPSTTEVAYVCYRVSASTAQTAANYENKLIYTATATF